MKRSPLGWQIRIASDLTSLLDMLFGYVKNACHNAKEACYLNNRLKVLRAERDWSQADLAAKLDVSRQSVNAIETGKYDPSLPLAFKIARLFALPIEQIFPDEGE